MTHDQLVQGQPVVEELEKTPAGPVFKVGSPKDIEAKCGAISLTLTGGSPPAYKFTGPSIRCPAGQYPVVTGNGVFCEIKRYD